MLYLTYVMRVLATFCFLLVCVGVPQLGPVPMLPCGLALWVGSTLIPPPGP